MDAAGYPLNLHVIPLLAALVRAPLADIVIDFLLERRSIVEKLLRACYYEPDRVLTPHALDGYYLPLRTPGVARTFPLLARDFAQTSLNHRLSSVRVPALVIWGQYDAILPLHWGYRFQRDLPQAELVVFPQCGHCPQEEYPERFLEVVTPFALAPADEPASPRTV